jgi:hypothetical protein
LGYPALLVSARLPAHLPALYKYKRFGVKDSDQNYWHCFPIMVGYENL